MDEQVANLGFHVNSLETYASVHEDKIDSLMEQMCAFDQNPCTSKKQGRQ